MAGLKADSGSRKHKKKAGQKGAAVFATHDVDSVVQIEEEVVIVEEAVADKVIEILDE